VLGRKQGKDRARIENFYEVSKGLFQNVRGLRWGAKGKARVTTRLNFKGVNVTREEYVKTRGSSSGRACGEKSQEKTKAEFPIREKVQMVSCGNPFGNSPFTGKSKRGEIVR